MNGQGLDDVLAQGITVGKFRDEKEMDVAASEVKVLAIQPVTWSDASLGCPDPDMVYAQVMTPGYEAQVEVSGETYTVHMDEAGNGVVCNRP